MIDRSAMARRFETRIGRLLIATTYVAVALLVAGVGLMVVGGVSPLDGGPPLDLTALVDDLRTLEPAGFLWLGLLAVIATPITRVIAAAIGFAREGDRMLVAVAIGILLVISVGVAAALAGSG